MPRRSTPLPTPSRPPPRISSSAATTPRQRQSVIAANPELQERELIKLAGLATAMAAALRDRGVPEPAASLAAEAGIAVFRVAFERWTAEDCRPDLAMLMRDSLDQLRAVTAGR